MSLEMDKKISVTTSPIMVLIFQKFSLLLKLWRDIIAHFGTDFANSEFTDPLKAVTRSGIVNVCKGSTMPKRGLKALFPIPVLAFNAS